MCRSQNITKLTLYQKKTQKGNGCLLLVLIIIVILMAPWIIPALGFGALMGVGAVSEELFMTIGGITFVIWVINAYQVSKTYICEKCGKKFQ